MKEKNAKNVSLEAGWLHGAKAGFCGAKAGDSLSVSWGGQGLATRQPQTKSPEGQCQPRKFMVSFPPHLLRGFCLSFGAVFSASTAVWWPEDAPFVGSRVGSSAEVT